MASVRAAGMLGKGLGDLVLPGRGVLDSHCVLLSVLGASGCPLSSVLLKLRHGG